MLRLLLLLLLLLLRGEHELLPLLRLLGKQLLGMLYLLRGYLQMVHHDGQSPEERRGNPTDCTLLKFTPLWLFRASRKQYGSLCLFRGASFLGTNAQINLVSLSQLARCSLHACLRRQRLRFKPVHSPTISLASVPCASVHKVSTSLRRKALHVGA